jgi:hypothetical protein
MVGVTINVKSLSPFIAGAEYLGVQGVSEVNRKVVNILAQDFAGEVRESLATTFDRPAPFTLRGISYDFARKGEDPVSRTFVRDRQSKYLLLQETGGVRRRGKNERGFEEIPLGPRDSKYTDQYGGYGRKGVYERVRRQSTKGGARGKTREKLGKRQGKVLFVMKKKDGESIGVFERTTTATRRKRELHKQRGKGSRRDTNVKLVILFADEAEYTPRFQFATRAKAFADRKFVPLQQRLFINEVRKRIGRR